MIFGAMAHLSSRLIEMSRYLYLILGLLMILGGLVFAGLILSTSEWFNSRCENTAKGVKTLPSAFIFGMLFAFLICQEIYL